MPVFNSAATVSAAIDSILLQTQLDFEFLIIDDGSTDDSAAIVEKKALQDQRIRLIRLDSNQGIAVALNTGWKQARGEYVARMDADDYSLPERLALQVAFLLKHEEVDILGTGVFMEYSDGRAAKEYLKAATHQELVAKLNLESPFFHPTVIFRRSFLERVGGYDVRWRKCEDFDLWWRSYKIGKFANLKQPLLRYRMPSTNGKLSAAIELLQCKFFVRYREGRIISACYWALFEIVFQILLRCRIWTLNQSR